MHMYVILTQSSEIRRLCLMKHSSEMPQNFSYFWSTTNIYLGRLFSRFLFGATLWSTTTYIILDHGINPGKNKVARNDEFKQTTYASWNISSSTNLLFLNSDLGMHNDIEKTTTKNLQQS